MNGIIPEWQCKHIFCQLIVTLNYLHNYHQIVHRDLKVDNIMLDKYHNIRLIDFGLGNTADNSKVLATCCGSPAYAPPEMILGKKYTFAVDIWSAGIVLFTITSGKLPFIDTNIQKLSQKIVSTEPEYPNFLPDDLKDLIIRMLDKNANTRITIPEILKHPWVASYPLLDRLTEKNMRDTESIDFKVLVKLEELGFNIDDVTDHIRSGVESDYSISYNIIKREVCSASLSYLFDAFKEKSKRAPIKVQASLPTAKFGRHRQAFPRPRQNVFLPRQSVKENHTTSALAMKMSEPYEIEKNATSKSPEPEITNNITSALTSRTKSGFRSWQDPNVLVARKFFLDEDTDEDFSYDPLAPPALQPLPKLIPRNEVQKK